MSKKQTETTYNEQEANWNNLPRPKKINNEQETTWKQPTTSETTRNDQQRVRHNL